MDQYYARIQRKSNMEYSPLHHLGILTLLLSSCFEAYLTVWIFEVVLLGWTTRQTGFPEPGFINDLPADNDGTYRGTATYRNSSTRDVVGLR